MLLFNIILTRNLLLPIKIALPLHTVISFSVINYVVSMRCLTGVTQLIFFVPYRELFTTFLYKSSNHPHSEDKLFILLQLSSFIYLIEDILRLFSPLQHNPHYIGRLVCWYLFPFG